MTELKIEHVALCTNSEAESDKFFIELLGCKKTRAFTVSTELMEQFFGVTKEQDVVRYTARHDDGVNFEIFVMNDDSKARDIFTHSCILIPDRDEFVSRANAMNYKTIQVPRKNSDSYYLFIKDNYGNLFEVKNL